MVLQNPDGSGPDEGECRSCNHPYRWHHLQSSRYLCHEGRCRCIFAIGTDDKGLPVLNVKRTSSGIPVEKEIKRQ